MTPEDQKLLYRREIRVVLLLHDLGNNKNSWLYPVSELSKKYMKLKDFLLSLGYAIAMPDAKYHGDDWRD